MLMCQLLCQIGVASLNGFHDLFMLFVRLWTSIGTGQRLLTDTENILMEILQLMLQHLAVTGFIQNIMETIV